MSSQTIKGVAAKSQALPKSIRAGLILSRIPIVTADLTKLESQYYRYQSELEKRLMWTFPQYFYYKKGTLAEKRFLEIQKGPISKQPGVWFPKGVPDIKHNRERSKKQEIALPKEVTEDQSYAKHDVSRPIKLNSRVTDADESGNVKSLERKLSRTLYLLVKGSDGKWVFPSFPVSLKSQPKVPLHEVVESGLRTLCGENIKTWIVSNTPAGVLQTDNDAEFLIKSHIIAGKFDLFENSLYKEFAWLAKDEIKTYVDENYFNETGFLLADN